jgi:hypothetical protein
MVKNLATALGDGGWAWDIVHDAAQAPRRAI